MPDSEKSNRSIQLIQLSFRVVKKNKKLLVFPSLDFVFTLMIFAIFFVPAMLGPTGSSWDLHTFVHRLTTILRPWSADGHTGIQWVGYIRLPVLYLGSMFFTTFVNVAFYHEIIKAMAGEAVSLRRGFALACQRIQTILAWSLFAGSIGMLIQLLAERFGFIGKFVLRLVGFTWSVASAFVIPIMIRNESANPIVLLRSSAATIRKTWGEFVIGYAWIQLLPVVILLSLLVFFCIPKQGSSLMMGSCLIAAWFLTTMAYGFLINTANSIFRCALYIYASEGVVPESYTSDMMDAAWKVKRS